MASISQHGPPNRGEGAADRWAQLFQAFPLPIATLAADGTVIEVNRAATALGTESWPSTS